MQWFYSGNLLTLSSEDRQLVEYLTGRIPLLLRSLFDFKNTAFNEQEFLNCRDLSKVNQDIVNFYRAKAEEHERSPATRK